MLYKLQPVLSPKLWGGYKLSSIYKKERDKIGEAWVMSALGNNSSLIDNKRTLLDLFNENKDIVKKGYQGEFPLLAKLIDAMDDLSIQVHPDAKTECWHILSKNPSKLYLGLNKDSSKEEIDDILNNGDITDVLNYIDVKKDDTYLIKPGTIHAIGKGTFLIEIQRSADITYRLYDFNRLDKDGNKRELHITQALEVLNYQKMEPVNLINNNPLVSTPFFNVYKIEIDGEKEFVADENSFNDITVIEGNGRIIGKDNNFVINQYDNVFIPSNEGKYILKGKMVIILVTL